jgi:formylglycine-generating enzyme required for sulfatase activity
VGGCQLVVGSYSAGGEDAASHAATDARAPRDGAVTRGDSGIDAGGDAVADALQRDAVSPGDVSAADADAGPPRDSAARDADSSPDASPCTCATLECVDGGCSGATSGAGDPSCSGTEAALTTCGTAVESCCVSAEVLGGDFYRTFEVVDGGATALQNPATVSGLRVDKYLVTVGRFRRFVDDYRRLGVPPVAGSGIHAHLHGGKGLQNAASASQYEAGWKSAWNASLSLTDANLGSCADTLDGGVATFSTWTASAGQHENLPINCVNWYEAYAFCIWDGGFLPSENEWEYTAAGGHAQREYPWGDAPPSNEYAVFGCRYDDPTDAGCTSGVNIAPVGLAPKGAGVWGQLDLSGDMFEWTLDDYSSFVVPCADCAYLTDTGTQSLRGGAFNYDSTSLLVTHRESDAPSTRNNSYGVRCARRP